LEVSVAGILSVDKDVRWTPFVEEVMETLRIDLDIGERRRIHEFNNKKGRPTEAVEGG
jgi:hypothetical protein